MVEFFQQFSIKPKFKNYIYIVILAIIIFGLALLSIQNQSTQFSVSLFWPISGLIFAAFFIVGFWLWPAVLLGGYFFSLTTDVPLVLVLVLSVISIFQASLFITIARNVGFKGHLRSFKDCFIFSMIAFFAPAFSTVLGSVVMSVLIDGSLINALDMMMHWWLADSLGLLLMGATILSFQTIYHKLDFSYRIVEKVLMMAGIILVFGLAFSQKDALNSALLVNLIIPIIFLGALRFGAFGTAFLGLLFMLLLSLFSDYAQHITTEQSHFGVQYLIIVKIWVVCISGVLIAGAFADNKEKGRLKWQAHHDGLTGLLNRVAMEKEIEVSLSGARTADQKLCLLFLDVDHFKQINDRLGHKKGDELLRDIAEVLKSSVRNIDVVARWGGDEFIVLLRQCTDEQAMAIGNKILVGIKTLSFTQDKHHYPLSMSIGVASAILGEPKLRFIERADAASYAAKKNGKDQAVFS